MSGFVERNALLELLFADVALFHHVCVRKLRSGAGGDGNQRLTHGHTVSDTMLMLNTVILRVREARTVDRRGGGECEVRDSEGVNDMYQLNVRSRSFR